MPLQTRGNRKPNPKSSIERVAVSWAGAAEATTAARAALSDLRRGRYNARMPGEPLPPPDDPGPRFLAPAGKPTVASDRAEPVLRAAGLARRLDARAATVLL